MQWLSLDVNRFECIRWGNFITTIQILIQAKFSFHLSSIVFIFFLFYFRKPLHRFYYSTDWINYLFWLLVFISKQWNTFIKWTLILDLFKNNNKKWKFSVELKYWKNKYNVLFIDWAISCLATKFSFFFKIHHHFYWLICFRTERMHKNIKNQIWTNRFFFHSISNDTWHSEQK